MGNIVSSLSDTCIYSNPCNKKPTDPEPLTSESDIDETPHYPGTIIDMKIKTSDLISKRHMSPWEQYEEICTLGQGSYGTVKRVRHLSSNVIRAMKIIPKSNLIKGVDNSTVISEISILKSLDHPNIMKIFEFYEDNTSYYLLSEYCDQGDLLSKMEKLHSMSEVVVKLLMMQILNAVAYLHSRHVLHGDIKMENILLYTSSNKRGKRFTVLGKESQVEEIQREINESFKNRQFSEMTKSYVRNITNYEVKLIDFGCSKFFNKKSHKNLSGIIGTSIYCSPEVVDDYYDEKSDEWSLGVLLYLLLAGQPPFQGQDEEEVFTKIKKGKFHFNYPELKKVSKNCRDLISKLLAYKPSDRISAADALQHPFFSESFNPGNALTAEKDLSILTNLISLKPIGKFQETMLAYITLNFLDITEEKKLREVFRFIDKDGNYVLSKEELKNCLNENGYHLSKEDLDKLFEVIDSDHNGTIEYQEFIRRVSDKKKLLSDQNLKAAFNLFDTKNNNCVTWDDINKAIFAGKEMSDEIIEDYLKEFGKKRTDTMNFEEFCAIMRESLIN